MRRVAPQSTLGELLVALDAMKASCQIATWPCGGDSWHCRSERRLRRSKCKHRSPGQPRGARHATRPARHTPCGGWTPVACAAAC
jgi:hypothetical protein